MKHFRRAATLILLLAFCLIPFASCGAVRRPLRYARAATERTLENGVAGRIAEVLSETVSGGALSASFTGAENGISAAEGTLYFFPDADRLAASGKLTLGEKTYDLSCFFDREGVVFGSSAFLGSSVYGIPFGTLEKDIAASVFRNNSGTPYANPKVDDATAGEIRGFAEAFFALYAAGGEMRDTADSAADVFLAALEERANTVYYRRNGRTYIEVTADNGAISGAMRDARNRLISDRKFCRNLRTWAKQYDELLSAVRGEVSEETLNRAEYFLTNETSVEKLCTAIDLAPTLNFYVNATVRNLTRRAEKLTVGLTAAGDRAWEFAFDITEKNAAAVSAFFSGKEYRLSLSSVTKNRKKFGLEYELAVTGGGKADIAVRGALSLDRKTDAYTLTLIREDVTRTVEGTFALSSKGWRLSADRVRLGEQEIACGFAVAAVPGAKMPDTPEYTNLFAVDSTRFSLTAEILFPQKERFSQDLESLAPTPRGTLASVFRMFGLEDILPDHAGED